MVASGSGHRCNYGLLQFEKHAADAVQVWCVRSDGCVRLHGVGATLDLHLCCRIPADYSRGHALWITH